MVDVSFSLLGGAGWQFFDNSGRILSGGRIYTYEAGSTTPSPTYTTSDGNVSNGVYVQLDSAGRPSEEIWLITGQSYKFVVKRFVSTGVYAEIRTYDDISGAVADSFIAELASTAGAGLVGLNQLTVYPENSLGAKLTRTLSLKDGPFNAKGDGSTDDTDAINSWLAHAGPGTELICPASGAYKFTSALDAITAENVNVSGPGQLRYMGGSTNPGNLVSIGDGIGTYYGINWGVDIASSTVLTGGYALWIKSCQAVSLDCILGNPYETLSLFKGVYMNATEVKYNNTFICGLNTLLSVDAGYEHHCQNLYLLGNSASPAGYGVHIGGGVGGFYSEQLTQQFNDIGCMIDTTLNATGNLQLFFETGAFDVNTSACMKINDSSVNPTGKSIKLGCWLASSTAGPGLFIQEWKGGKLAIGAAAITNNFSSAIYTEDPNCLLEISDGLSAWNNRGWGLDAAVPVTVRCLADLSSNDLGATAPNVTVRNITLGRQQIVQNPTLQWAQDFTGNSVTIANGGNAILPSGSGLIAVTNTTNGETAIYSCGGAVVSNIAIPSSWENATTTPAGGKASIAYDGASAYRIYNNAGGSRTFNVMLSMTRAQI